VVRETFPDDKERVFEALEEHHAAKSLLAEIDRLPPTHEKFRAKVMVLIESVERHIEEEEHTRVPGAPSGDGAQAAVRARECARGRE
jgi:hypothetical protein